MYFCACLNYEIALLVPVVGRSGNNSNPELLVALVLVVLSLLATLFTALASL